MLKKRITYETFDGETVTESFYFHLSKADLVELEVSHQGGMQAWIKEIIDSEDGAAILKEFKKVIGLSYGVKSDDGRRFNRSEQLTQDFMSSPAYDVLFMELVTDAEKAGAFINGIIPNGLNSEKPMSRPHPSDPAAIPAPSTSATDEAERVKNLGNEEETGENVFDKNATRFLTPAEVREMDADELKSGLATGRYQLQ